MKPKIEYDITIYAKNGEGRLTLPELADGKDAEVIVKQLRALCDLLEIQGAVLPYEIRVLDPKNPADARRLAHLLDEEGGGDEIITPCDRAGCDRARVFGKRFCGPCNESWSHLASGVDYFSDGRTDPPCPECRGGNCLCR